MLALEVAGAALPPPPQEASMARSKTDNADLINGCLGRNRINSDAGEKPNGQELGAWRQCPCRRIVDKVCLCSSSKAGADLQTALSRTLRMENIFKTPLKYTHNK
ncbi:MAG: hypothetical protein K8963_07100, partial [Proteobacteria bacterium]|nr:hypothetical protein [Pseudomonadota bacterium]